MAWLGGARPLPTIELLADPFPEWHPTQTATPGWHLFGFEADKLLYVFETSISVDSRRSEFKSSDGAAHDCQEILSPSFKPVEDVTFDDVPCQQARGTWRIDGDGIAFTFREAARSVDESGQLGRLSRSVTHARVELRGEGLKPVAGALPGYGI